MRKVSLDIAHAFKGKDKRSISNTSTDGKRILLHGNEIASWNDDNSLVVSMCNWPTVTTRERINTLFYVLNIPFNMFQDNYGQFIRDYSGLPNASLKSLSSGHYGFVADINPKDHYAFHKQKDLHSLFDTNVNVWHIKHMEANHEYLIKR